MAQGAGSDRKGGGVRAPDRRGGLKASLWLAAAALAGATPVAAQVPVPPGSATLDPARLAEARLVIARLLPPGVYRTLMTSTMGPLIDNMGDSMKALPLRQLAEVGGLDATQAAALDRVDLERVIAIYDPHWRERSQVTMRAMFTAMGDFFTTLEPELREAYAQAFANRFSLAELQDLNRFYQTPTGAKFATQFLTISTDPAIAGEMRVVMPKVVAQMPTFLAAAQRAAASLPPARKLKDLSPAEREKLAKALGVSPSQLRDPPSPL